MDSQQPVLFDTDPSNKSQVTSQLPERLGNTVITSVRARSILTPQKPGNFVEGFHFSLNPFFGCQFGCDYCYAMFWTHDEQKMQQWGKWVDVKTNAAEIIRYMRPDELLDKKIYMSTATDPWQPIERTAKVTRDILDALIPHKAKLVCQTRSPLVTRDIDKLLAIAENNNGCVQVNMTITTDNDGTRKKLEPMCPSIPARLKAVKELQDAGIQTCITLTPLIGIWKQDEFAERMLETGCKRFIIQTFHNPNNRNAQQGQRATRATALQWFEEMRGPNWLQGYTKHYNEVCTRYTELLPQVAFGKQGFKPPF